MPIRRRGSQRRAPTGPRIKVFPQPASDQQAPRRAEPVPDEKRLGVLGRFTGPVQTLACWSLLLGESDEHDPPVLHREPGGAYWLVAWLSPGVGAGLIWASGGDAYRVEATAEEIAFVPLGGTGHPPPAPAELVRWPEANPLSLVPRVPLAPGRERAYPALGVLTTGQLAHQIIRRCLADGANVAYRPVLRHEVFVDAGEPEPAVLIRVSGPGAGEVPRRLVAKLTRLPHTIVGRYADPGESLLLDVDFRLPAQDAHLCGAVPAGARWVIGRAGAGAWAVDPQAGEKPAHLMLTAPGLPLTPAPAVPGARGFRASERIEVGLVRSSRHHGPIDAVLLERDQLGALAEYMRGRPLAEEAYLIPGQDAYLLTEPARLLNSVPLGRPLRRVGPFGFYLAHGYALDPPLPPAAREDLFAVSPSRAVVVCPGEAIAFDVERARPVWHLWLPDELPAFRGGLPERGRAILERIERARAGREDTAAQEPGSEARRARLRLAAIQAQLADEPEEAARLLEEAGDYARAALALERLARAEEEA
ncbi:hypothetical protein HNP84_004144 [Thermocatellispora tengchongensis]|uniref:FtsH ternary system domain-containing protein n=1 Tax=Thermocatellispora tengchongensis TaxID=1073253 RepID=A0A840P4Y9_9ACTN|nr:hypothetical protein [Thermocatellispora tengchongensis]MBB5134412.1 hypothetical protein [Thermocatellispora tengchongensis]